ncbi:MAG: DUF1598 domain-containing protein [Planctomycetota bacterium]|nr:DUF1598 domain-containing protein [Planctomycetaceae bacterium]MDQ3332548.1 DUF1598 domain-containing protein [Planctomycetota bacterium]
MRPIRFGRFARGFVAAGLLAAPLCAAETASTTIPPTAERVDAHLAAGEFSAAAQLAANADPAIRGTLIEQVFEAETAAGEFLAAGLIASRFPEVAGRDAVVDEATAGDLAGGAQGLQELIQLIQQTTGGPPTTGWLDIDGTGGTIAPFGIGNQNPGGVSVDPLGKMMLLAKADTTARLRDLAFSARVADLNADMANASDLRVVSLTRLEREVAERLARGEAVPTSMRQLAGLTRVQYVFLDETTREILVAGPAEGWRYDESGAAVGAETGKPVLHLDDLVTVLRTFGPQGASAFQCSIDPRAEGMKAVQEYAANSAARGPLNSGAGVRNFANRLGQLLGEQDVYVGGVPVDSRVARVIVEADYRMKLIGIDKLQAASLPSFFDLLSVDSSAEPVATKALRWWLTMNYEAVLHSNDKTAFEFVGQAVKCLSEDEFLNADGERVSTGRAEATNRLFADRFTAGYEELASTDPVFAELRNVFDLSLAAALIRSERLDERADWNGGVFAANGAYQPASYVPAESVATAVNHRVYNGSEVVVQVAGGVRGDLMSLLQDTTVYRTAIRTGEAVASVKATPAPETRWWWDAK